MYCFLLIVKVNMTMSKEAIWQHLEMIFSFLLIVNVTCFCHLSHFSADQSRDQERSSEWERSVTIWSKVWTGTGKWEIARSSGASYEICFILGKNHKSVNICFLRLLKIQLLWQKLLLTNIVASGNSFWQTLCMGCDDVTNVNWFVQKYRSIVWKIQHYCLLNTDQFWQTPWRRRLPR